MSLVCAYCKEVVVRGDVTLASLGKVSEVTASEHALVLRDQGTYLGHEFEVLGRVIFRHPKGGTWEEYYASFGEMGWSWITTAQGRWYITSQVTAVVTRTWDTLSPGREIDLSPYGTFRVAEQNLGEFLDGQGELPFTLRPGTIRRFVDLSGADGRWASIDFTDDTKPPTVYAGMVITREALGLKKRVAEPDATRVPLAGLKCPNCGGDLPARAGKQSQRVACPYCKALSDLETHKVIAYQQELRGKLTIPLGKQGRIHKVPWTVVGFMRRSTVIEGERFVWSEYLLYNVDKGFTWLIEDEGAWLIGTPLQSGDVDTSGYPRRVQYKNNPFKARNAGEARVEYVLGEFYWKVEVGETVDTRDFERFRNVISREESAGEVQWTYSTVIPAEHLFGAFELPVPPPPPPPPSQYASYNADDENEGPKSEDELRSNRIMFAVMAFLVLVMLSMAYEDCDDGDGGSGGGHGSSFFGGFGGK